MNPSQFLFIARYPRLPSLRRGRLDRGYARICNATSIFISVLVCILFPGNGGAQNVAVRFLKFHQKDQQRSLRIDSWATSQR